MANKKVYFTKTELENLSNQLLQIREHRLLYQKKYNRLHRRIKAWHGKLKSKHGALDPLKSYPKCMSDNQAWFLANYQYLTITVFIAMRDAFNKGYVIQ